MLILEKRHYRGYRVRITDCMGNVEVADDVRDAASRLKVAVHTIYQAICEERTVRGCRVDRVVEDKEDAI